MDVSFIQKYSIILIKKTNRSFIFHFFYCPVKKGLGAMFFLILRGGLFTLIYSFLIWYIAERLCQSASMNDSKG